jgi:hypothetical protein
MDLGRAGRALLQFPGEVGTSAFQATGRWPSPVTVDQAAADVLGPTAPPKRPVPGRGRPRTQVEPGSLGSGRPPIPLPQAAQAEASGRARLELTAAELTALQQLADASCSVVARWPVGRAVALALIRRGLVHACSEWAWLTQAGREVLDAAPALQPVQLPDPQPDGTVDQTARPADGTADSDRQPARRPQPATPLRGPAGGELPRGVLPGHPNSQTPPADDHPPMCAAGPGQRLPGGW